MLLENRGADRTRWNGLIAALPEDLRDVHYTPEYFDIYERTYGHPASLFVFECASATVIQPFLRRGLAELPRLDAAGLSDLESPYGYGGPLLVKGEAGPALAAAYEAALLELAARWGFVSEYCALHPLHWERQKALLPAGLALTYRKEVSVADLTEPLHAIWSRVEDRQRKAVAIARRRGVVIRREDPTDETLARFHAMYSGTMERKGAGKAWRWPERYWAACRDGLGREGMSLFTATAEGRWAAAFFLIHGHSTAYYHFAASDPELNRFNATSLLLMDTMLWAKSAGYRTYHMGGGRTDATDDSLFRFKDSFAKRTRPLYVYGRVLMPDVFARLARASGDGGAGFFPPYRAS